MRFDATTPGALASVREWHTKFELSLVFMTITVDPGDWSRCVDLICVHRCRMARIAVLHNTLDFRGGADAVALATCESLAASHSVDLYTISSTNPAELAEQYGLDVTVTVRSPPGGTHMARGFAFLGPYFGPLLDARSALLGLFFRTHADEYDLAVSTTNELALPIPSVQYIHYPQFNLGQLGDRANAAGLANAWWSWLAGPSPTSPSPDVTYLANSEWTARAVETIYRMEPQVVYPPVPSIDDGRPWSQRQDGIVLLGRIAPDRNVLQAIELIDAIRHHGCELHLHLVGSTGRAYRSYLSHVQSAADKRSYVHLETDVSRDRLEELLSTHRYGLNLRRDESFGIAVAEYVAAGMLAFAPAAGGQQEILADTPHQLFTSLEEATDRIIQAIETDMRPPSLSQQFSREQFQRSMREIVARKLQ